MTRSKVIARMAAVAPAILDAWSKPNTGMGRCVLSTAVGLKVLAELGIAAEPLAVRVAVWNRAWASLPHPNATPEQRDAVGAWSVEVGAPVAGPGWNGHLIIRAGDVAIDLNSGAMHRPLRGLPVPPSLVFPWRPLGVQGSDHGTGVSFLYEPIDDQTFQTAKDWNADHAPVVRAIVRAIRKPRGAR